MMPTAPIIIIMGFCNIPMTLNDCFGTKYSFLYLGCAFKGYAIETGEFAVDERGVPGRYGRTSGGESESTMSIRYCGETFSPVTPERKGNYP